MRLPRQSWMKIGVYLALCLVMLVCSMQIARADIISDITTIATKIATIASNILPSVPALVQSVADMATTGSGYLPQLAGHITTLGTKIIEIQTQLDNIKFDILRKLIENAFSLGNQIGTLGTYLSTLGSGLASLVAAIDTGFGTALEAITDIHGSMVGAYADFGSFIIDGFSKLHAVLTENSKGLHLNLEILGDQAKDKIDFLKNHLGEIKDELPGRYDTLGSDIQEQFTALDGLLGGRLLANLQALEKLGGSLANLARDPDKVTRIFETLAELFVGMGSMYVEGKEDELEARLAMYLATVKVLPKVLAELPGLVKGLNGSQGPFWEDLEAFARDLPDWLNSIPDKVEEKMQGVVDSLTQDITQILSLFKVTEGINSVMEASDRDQADILEKLTSLSASIAENFATLQEQLSAQPDMLPIQGVMPPDDGLIAEYRVLAETLRSIEESNEALRQANQQLKEDLRVEALSTLSLAQEAGD